MKHHGPKSMRAFATETAPAFEMANERRITLSVVIDGTPGLAERLARVLAWRGYAFDRVVVQEGADGRRGRLQLTLTDTDGNAEALQALIRRYAPVHALRTLYTAPVMRQKAPAEIRSLAAAC